MWSSIFVQLEFGHSQTRRFTIHPILTLYTGSIDLLILLLAVPSNELTN